jgi:hypothetical protein
LALLKTQISPNPRRGAVSAMQAEKKTRCFLLLYHLTHTDVGYTEKKSASSKTLFIKKVNNFLILFALTFLIPIKVWASRASSSLSLSTVAARFLNRIKLRLLLLLPLFHFGNALGFV